ncbi:MAG TPA: hypothetical protein VF411_00835, partial [Bacteroidia bacterium]
LSINEIIIGLGGKMPIKQLNKERFRQQELNKSYISIIRSFQNFIDKLIAIIDLTTKRILVDRNLNSEQDLNDYLQQMEDKSIQSVSKDRKLNFPKKLDYFEIEEITKEILTGYSGLRNNLEHHKDIASKDTIFKSFVLTLYVNDIEVTSLPYNALKGDSLVMKNIVTERLIKQGTTVQISETEIYNIAYTLGKVICLNIIQKTNDKLLAK